MRKMGLVVRRWFSILNCTTKTNKAGRREPSLLLSMMAGTYRFRKVNVSFSNGNGGTDIEALVKIAPVNFGGQLFGMTKIV